jgi:hypothetical protein
MSELFAIIKESEASPVEVPKISKEKKSTKKTEKEKPPKEIKPFKIDKSMEYLFAKINKKEEEAKDKPKSPSAIAREILKMEKEKLKLAKKELLKPCKGKTKDNKDCSRKEMENCDGFCKQHYAMAKETANRDELIEKHKKPDVVIL